jgi:excisionase family DNA binding protein
MSSIAFVRSIIALVQAQWRPYNYTPQPAVYERLGCPYAAPKSRKRPIWFVRGDVFTCIGCSKGCSLSRPAGFCLPLPVEYPEAPDKPFALTPAEMVQSKALLRVDEVAYCLNVSESKVYKWVAEGKLLKVRDQPIRIAAEEVASRMRDFDD